MMGMLGGYVTGLLAGVLISIPAMFNQRTACRCSCSPRWACWAACCAILRPDKESIWQFSPFPDLSLWRLLRRRDLRLPAFSLACVLVILLAEFLRATVARHFRRRLRSRSSSGAMRVPG